MSIAQRDLQPAMTFVPAAQGDMLLWFGDTRKKACLSVLCRFEA
jgi:hypothetical protein